MSPFAIGLAFVEGLALIASPCILPVLPLVLSSSLEGGKRRPFGIITGFVLAFTLFALFSRWLVSALHIDLELIRRASLVLLFVFGLVLVSDKLSQIFSRLTQGAANLGSRVSGAGGNGYLSGVAIGALIGFIWTPCAGPILAAVLVQVIQQQTDFAAVAMIVAFALGAGTPMLIIALVGRKAMSKLGFLTSHSELLRKGMGVVILLWVALLASGIDLTSSSGKSHVATGAGLEEALTTPYKAPELTGLEGWINSRPLTLAELRGKVVLIDFWTYSCINCVRTLPHITQWDATYRNKGLVIIGISAPEFEFEKSRDNVTEAAKKRDIQYPIALDNNLATWTAYKNQYWPAHYLIDQKGNVVYTHFGEGEYDVTEHNIRVLLGLKDEAPTTAEMPAMWSTHQTPETYLGYARAERSGADFTEDKPADYTLPNRLPADNWALSGKWQVGAQVISATESGASIRLNFHARHVYLVLGTKTGRAVLVTLRMNGKPLDSNAGKDVKDSMLTVDQHTLYELVDQGSAKSGVLDITADQKGLEAYAFTFGG